MRVCSEKDLLEVIKKIGHDSLSSIKNSITEIIIVINNPHSNAHQLTKTIEHDTSLTARILRVANSAYYGANRQISDIRQAIVRIGFDLIKELVLSQKVVELFKNNNNLELSPVALWQHSVAVAYCAKAIYRREFRLSGTEIFTAGILHDIGIIIESQFLTEQFQIIFEKKKMMRDNIVNAEISEMSLSHAKIASVLLKDWNLPNNLTIAVGNHHNPKNVQASFYQLSATLYLADYMVQKRGIGFSDTPFLNKNIFRKTIQRLKIPLSGLEMITDDIELQIAEMKKKGWFDDA